MKIIVISDTHGRDLWKDQVKEPADMYIFIGDYFDSFDIDGQTQIDNFKDILTFYQENKDKVVLLAGNHCLSEDTEVLTEKGFKTIQDYIENPCEIATYNTSNGNIEYQKPTDVIYKDYEGEMYSFRSQNVDMLVTPEHRVLGELKNGTEKGYTFKKAKDFNIKSKSVLKIPVAGNNINPDYDILDQEIELVAWVLSDGSLKKGVRGTSYGIYQSKEDNIEIIQNILNELNVKFSKNIRSRNILQICGIKLKSCKKSVDFNIPQGSILEKLIPGERYDFPEWLRKLSKRQFDIFLKTYTKADGHTKDKNAAIHGNYKALTFIQELCTLNNIRSFIKTNNRGHFVLNVALNLNSAEFHINRYTSISDYKGKVFCFTLPNGTFIARRNGKVFVTGNCLSYIDVNCRCSGYQNKYAYEIGQLIKPLRENGDLKACKVINNHIFVHAGITQTWIEDNNIDLNNLEKEVNELFQKNLEPFCFQNNHKISRYVDPYGDDIFQSPMWVRPYSLGIDKPENYQQIVGHTGMSKVIYNNDVWFTDCQDSSDDFLILEI